MEIKCPHCQIDLVLSPEDMGKRLACPNCHGIIVTEKAPTARVNRSAVKSRLIWTLVEALGVLALLVFGLYSNWGLIGGFLAEDEQFVMVKCPRCNAETIHEWKNSHGEKIIHKDHTEYCINCESHFEIPQKYW